MQRAFACQLIQARQPFPSRVCRALTWRAVHFPLHCTLDRKTDHITGANGTTGVARVCPASSTSTLTFEYRVWPDDASVGSIDISHKGPCAVYLKKADSAIDDTAAGQGWFKIWDEGYDEAAGKWCTEKLMPNNGRLSVQLPDGLEGGYYLVRPELLALQQADETPSDPQFYIGCAQIFLQSSGTGTPQDTVEIPGHVAEGQPSLVFDIWTVPMALPYPLPGPAIYAPTGDGTTPLTTLQQTEGLKPADCVLENANWCGIELSPYNTADGCWNASTNCWGQCSECYNTSPPTGSVNCPIWEAKCTQIQQNCGAGDFSGPPDAMKALTPSFVTLSLPAPDAAQTGDGSYLPTSAVGSSLGSSATAYTTMPAPQQSTTPAQPLQMSVEGACGEGTTCQGSTFGDCCSSHGYCGSSAEYCGVGCQSAFGTCFAGMARKRDGHMSFHLRNLLGRKARHL